MLFSFVVHNLLICLDPFLVQSIEKAVPRWARIGLRILCVLSLGIGLLSAWNITPGSYLFYVHEALPFTPLGVLVSLVIATLLLLWLLLYRDATRQYSTLSVVLAVAGMGLLVFKTVSSFGGIDSQWAQQHLRSPLILLARMVYHVNDDPHAPVNGTPGDTFNAFVRAQPGLPPKIIFLVAESWGERADSLKQIGAALQDERLRMVKSGFTTYRGSTLSGEFRELCSKYLAPSDELTDDVSRLDCAPAFLQRQGYETWGLHGYQKAFYARGTLWNRFGITRKLFSDDLSGLEQCLGAFEGACDTALIQRGVEILDSTPGRGFVYLLTLSGHEPLAPSALAKSAGRLNGVVVVHPTQVVARRAISDLVVELERKRDRPCTLVYIAGDHQPPSASAQSGVFENNQVPFLAFTYDCPPALAGAAAVSARQE